MKKIGSRWSIKRDSVAGKKRVVLSIKPFILFAFCLLMYMPKFNISSVLLQVITYGIPIIYILFNLKKLEHVSLRQWKILFLAVLISMLAWLFPIIHGTGDYSYFNVSMVFFKKAIVYTALLCLIIKHHGKEKALQQFMYYFALAHVAYVVGTVLMVLFPKIQDLWFSIADKGEIMGNYAGRLFRIGWQGFSGFRLTLYCTISVIFLLYLRYGSKNPYISNSQFLIASAGCIIGNMFYGRSGLIISLLVCVISLVYWNRKNIKRLVIMFVTIVLLVLGVSTMKYIPTLSNWYVWMSSPIVNLVTTGDIQDKSFDELQEMQQVEISEETFLHGDGYYNEDGHYYKRTDAGFIRNILFWGVIGALISYGTTIYAVFGFSKISKLLVLQLLITFLAFEYKGAVYYEFLPLAFAIEAAFLASRDKLSNSVLTKVEVKNG